LLVPIQTVFQHAIFVPISPTISCTDTMNSAPCASLYVKNCGFKTLSTHTMTKIFSRYFAGTGSVFSTDTWRKEYKSRTFKPAHYFSQLPRDVSAHVTRTSLKKKKFSNAKCYDGKEWALFRW